MRYFEGKRFLLMFSVLAMFFVIFGITASSAHAESPSVILEEEAESPSGAAYVYTDEEARAGMLSEAESFPERYDLRAVDTDGDGTPNANYVTSVKLQSPFGSCWAFAAAAAAETSLISSGLADQTVNLSERHLAYFTRTPNLDKESSQYKEGYKDDGMSAVEKLNAGGYAFLATSVFASGAGPVEEKEDPDLLYKGRNGWIEQRYFGGALQNFSYSAEDDWSIPDEKRFLQDYALKESYVLPSPAQEEEYGYGYVYDEAGTAAIKKQLLAGRAVEIGIYSDKFSPNQTDSSPLFLSEDWAQYVYHPIYSNHAVTIVGWDDTIGSEESGVHFREDRLPPANGAFLVKNSWGSGEEEFPNAGEGDWGIQVPKTDADGNTVMVGSGYFWLSYYDQSISLPEALLFEKADPDLKADAYDYMSADHMEAREFAEEVRMANTFTAKENKVLEQIAFQTTHPQTTVHYQVYLNLEKSAAPTSGKLAAEGEETFEFGGFHRIALKEPVPVLSGQSYSIVVTETLKNARGALVYTTNVPAAMAAYNVSIINEGESRVFINGSWAEQKSVMEKLVVDNSGFYTFDNFSIKGYCRPLGLNFSLSIVGNLNLCYRFQEEALLTVQATVRGRGPENLHLQWRNENESLLKVTPLKDDFSARISVRQEEGEYPEGSVGLYLDVYDGDTFLGTVVNEANVSRPVFELIYSDKGYRDVSYPYTGKPVTPKVIVKDPNGNIMEEGTDYELSYENNVKCGGAKVNVTAKGATNPNSKGEWFFAICPAKAKVANFSVGERQMTVFAQDQRKSGADGYEIQYRKVGTQEWTIKPFPFSDPEVLLLSIDAGEYEIRIRASIEIFSPAKYNHLVGGLYYGEFSETVVSPKVKAGSLKWVYVIAHPKAVYTGKAVTLDLYLKNGDQILKKGKEYTITYKNNVHVGTADVIIKGKDGYYGTLEKHFYILPKGTEIKALTAGKGAIKVQWKKQAVETDGYQIRYAKTKGFDKTKTVTVKSTKKLSRVLRGLKSGQAYYFRVRTYKTVNGKTYFSHWSEIKGKKAK